ncbi:MAG TPA: hypothetical protein VNU75_05260 [Acidimicrobiales bacterium]|nr:hypothetical protein [Acidimicrobiales bacterium]
MTCLTNFAITTQTTTSMPAALSVRVPSNEAGNLAVYEDPAGIMLLLGPKDGWTCHGLYGADGSGGLLISPTGESVPNDPDAGWHLAASSLIQAIVGYETGGSSVQGAVLACSLFGTAATVYMQSFNKSCSTHPSQETVATISGVAQSFEDPAGVTGDGIPSGGQNAANGVVLYLPKPNEPPASIATCTLPESQHDLCTAVLNHFVLLYG